MSNTNRKTFLKQSALLVASPMLGLRAYSASNELNPLSQNSGFPMVISTWNHGVPANDEAWKLLSKGGSSLDAVEAGVKIPEADPKVTSVGYGGYPDETGQVTLDACIMDWQNNCGAVSYLQNIKHPISVARKVMEKTRHVMLSGKGALEFALNHGFYEEDLLTEDARKALIKYKNSQVKEQIEQKVDMHNHDTIGMLAIDKEGRISGACTTSGLAWKLNGRVGDSPIIGAGLFVDGKVGGATATGKGEAVIKIAGTAIIVEMMRNGMSPQQACEEAVKRITETQSDFKSFQVGFLAVNTKGEYGASSLQKGFQYAITDASTGTKLVDSDYMLK